MTLCWRWIAVSILLAAGAGNAWSQGVPGALATYWNNRTLTNPSFVTRIDNNIDFNLGTGSPGGGVNADNFSVRWTGSILIPTTGTYTFYTQSDDGVRLWIDCTGNGAFSSAEQLVDNWTDHSSTENSGSCGSTFSAGQYVAFRMEFYENAIDAVAKLSWSGPGIAVGSAGNRTAIPRGDGTRGLYSSFVDTVAPTLSSVTTTCGSVLVTFSEPVDSATATTIANYALDNGATITSATLSADATTVTLVTSALDQTVTYTLRVSNVRDLAVPPNTIAVNSAVSFVPSFNGLVGEYFDQNGVRGSYFTGTVYTRIDPTVNFDWSTGSPGFGIGTDNFSVRWTGYVTVPADGNYTFHTVSDDGVRLTVNGNRIINNFTEHASTVDSSAAVALTAGTYYPVLLEFFENGGFAEARLQWTGPGIGTRTAIPTTNLFTCLPATLANFAIAPGGSPASTCAARNVQITARNSSNQTVTSYRGTVTVSTSTGRGDWSRVSASGTLSDPVPDDGIVSYTFAAADAGSITLALSHTLAQTVNITVTDALVPAATRSAAVTFSDNTFVFTEDLSSRIAGSFVTVAGRDHDVRVTLVRRDPATGNQCGTATSYAGARTLKASIVRDGVDPGGSGPSIGGVAIPNAAATASVPLTFTAGVANFSLATSDVGKYSLTLSDDSGSVFPTPVSGSSSAFTVRPFGLDAVVTGNPAASTPGGSILASAGTAFAGSVRAVRWQALDDGNDDGVPDTGVSLADNEATPRYAWATTLSATAPFEPSAGILGSLAGGAPAASGFANGCAGCPGSPALAALAYDEVGSFTLRAAASGYLGTTGADVTDTGGIVVGRFTPFDFGVVYNTPRFDPGCTAGTFTYVGQPFNFASGNTPRMTLTARNRAGGVTRNYRGTWWKVTNPSLRPAAYDTQAERYTALAGSLDLSRLPDTLTDPAVVANGDGTGTLTFAGGTGFAFTRSAPLAPFNAEIALALNVIDGDGIAFAGNPARFGSATAGNGIAFTASAKQARFGRLRIGNALGTPVLSLPVPVRTEYWNGSGFVVNTQDSCTRLTSTDLALGNWSGALAAATCPTAGAPTGAGGVVFTAGIATFRLAAPGAGRSGSVDLTANLGTAAAGSTCASPGAAASAATTAASPWLQGNWAGAGYVANPAGRASFGRYTSTPDLIYRRESY